MDGVTLVWWKSREGFVWHFARLLRSSRPILATLEK